MEYYSAIKNSEILTHVTTRMNPEHIILSGKPDIKGQILHDSTHGAYLEQVHKVQ